MTLNLPLYACNHAVKFSQRVNDIIKCIILKIIFILKEAASAAGVTQITRFATQDLQTSILLTQLWTFEEYFWSANNLKLLFHYQF